MSDQQDRLAGTCVCTCNFQVTNTPSLGLHRLAQSDMQEMVELNIARGLYKVSCRGPFLMAVIQCHPCPSVTHHHYHHPCIPCTYIYTVHRIACITNTHAVATYVVVQATDIILPLRLQENTLQRQASMLATQSDPVVAAVLACPRSLSLPPL